VCVKGRDGKAVTAALRVGIPTLAAVLPECSLKLGKKQVAAQSLAQELICISGINVMLLGSV